MARFCAWLITCLPAVLSIVLWGLIGYVASFLLIGGAGNTVWTAIGVAFAALMALSKLRAFPED